MKNEIVVSEVQKDVLAKLDQNTVKLLMQTTFKGLTAESVKLAVTEGVIRGFNFKDFLEKNVYAVPFGQGYSLVTSIDYARKIGMRSGLVGESAPTYEMEDKKIVSCTITVKRKVGDYVGDYSATVFFDEYTTGRNLWTTKPKTMIAKVAEMHALRKACPEEMAQVYVEEEYQKPETTEANVMDYMEEVENINTIEELKTYYKANEGRGKEFARIVSERKKFLIQNNANTQPATK